MDEKTLERAKARIAEAAAGRIAPAELEAALERTRIQVESLAAAAAELEGTLPEKISAAVHDGLRAEVVPVGRSLAEIRGLLNQVIRRLERLEGDVLAERHARIDDLALLVDLVCRAGGASATGSSASSTPWRPPSRTAKPPRTR